jgi:hypothetical protein
VDESVPPIEAIYDSDLEIDDGPIDESHVANVEPLNRVDYTEMNTPKDLPVCRSNLTSPELTEIREMFNVPDYIELRLPDPSDASTERMFNPPMGSICVTKVAFAFGLRLPLAPFIVDFLRGLGLCLTQVTAIGMGHLVAWAVWMKRLDVPLTLENFAFMYSVCKSPGHPFFYFNQRPGASRFISFTSSLGSVSKWSAKYLYARFDPTKELPLGVDGHQFFGLPRLWSRSRVSLDAYRPKDTPAWFGRFPLSLNGERWNPYAFVVEPILYLAGLSMAEPARREIDSLGIYSCFE